MQCLDWLLILNRRHLERVVRTCVEHYNAERPPPRSRPPNSDPPDPPARVTNTEIRRRDKLGGLLHEYHGTAV